MDIPEPVRSAIEAWLRVHDAVAPDVVEGLYVVGSVALDDWWPTSDVDIVADLIALLADEVDRITGVVTAAAALRSGSR